MLMHHIENMHSGRVFFVQTEPNSGPNFGLTQPNFGLTQPNFGLTQSNFPPNSKFRAKMVKIVALTQKKSPESIKFWP